MPTSTGCSGLVVSCSMVTLSKASNLEQVAKLGYAQQNEKMSSSLPSIGYQVVVFLLTALRIQLSVSVDNAL